MCAKYCELRWMFHKKLHLVKVGVFAWCSIKIRFILVSIFKDEKLIEKSNLHENWNMQTLLWSILNISAKCRQNWSL